MQQMALEWAQALAERAPLSMAATKKVMRLAANKDWGEAYDMEANFQGDLLGSEDNKEGIQAFFEKRKPNFTGK